MRFSGLQWCSRQYIGIRLDLCTWRAISDMSIAAPAPSSETWDYFLHDMGWEINPITNTPCFSMHQTMDECDDCDHELITAGFSKRPTSYVRHCILKHCWTTYVSSEDFYQLEMLIWLALYRWCDMAVTIIDHGHHISGGTCYSFLYFRWMVSLVEDEARVPAIL